MVVVSAGMVKSGSLWYYRLIDESLVASGKKDDLLTPPHSPIEAFHKGDKIKCGLTFSNLAKLSKSARQGCSYPVKLPALPGGASSWNYLRLRIERTSSPLNPEDSSPCSRTGHSLVFHKPHRRRAPIEEERGISKVVSIAGVSHLACPYGF